MTSRQRSGSGGDRGDETNTVFAPVTRDDNFAQHLTRNPGAPIVLVACSGQKLAQAAPARDLYTSDLFKKARAWAEAYGAYWFILSAKHGVLPAGKVIQPYDESLNDKSTYELAAWNALVQGQFGSGHSDRPLVVLAGARYRGWLGQIVHQAPMRGMAIGKQKAWLKAEILRATIKPQGTTI